MKQTSFFFLLTFLLLFPCPPQAQEDTPLTAQELLIDMVGKTIVEETTQRSEEVRRARKILDAAMKAGTTEEQQEADEDLEKAEDRYAEAQKTLAQARLDAFADKCGKTSAEIQAMRNSGMGWGLIAKECGIHPSTAGKAKGKGKSKGRNKGKGKKK